MASDSNKDNVWWRRLGRRLGLGKSTKAGYPPGYPPGSDPRRLGLGKSTKAPADPPGSLGTVGTPLRWIIYLFDLFFDLFYPPPPPPLAIGWHPPRLAIGWLDPLELERRSKLALSSTGLETEDQRSTPGDSGYKDDKYPAEKGFPADVMRRLSEKYKTEERLVVPTTCPKDKTVFIVYDKECVRDKHQTDFGQEVLFRNPKSVNAEAIQVKNFCQENGNYISKDDRRMLKKCIAENCDTLLEKHRNINVISMSPVKSKENGKHIRPCLCVVIYCSSKGFIPFGENSFPKTLRSGLFAADTDIREGFFEFGLGTYAFSKSSNYHQQLRMGCQYAVEGKPICATIGPFVKLNGNMAFLTCAHAIYGIDSNGYKIVSNSTFVEQPPPTSAGFHSGNQFNYRCGDVKKAVFSPNAPSSVDAAVVLISEPTRLPHRGEFAMDNEIQLKNAGFNDLPYFDSGNIHVDPSTIDGDKRIVKFGAKTHVTRGNLIAEGTVISPVSKDMELFGQPGTKVTMKNQMEISGLASHGAYFQAGDSGAGVFYVDKTPAGQELTCIGIAIGSTSYGNAIVTPIKDVLDALQLPSLCQFP